MLEQPTRIQLSRAKGWKMPPNTVKVDRSTKWGNHWRVSFDSVYKEWTVWCDGSLHVVRDKAAGMALAVQLFREDTVIRRGRFSRSSLDALRGKNIGCWCNLPAPGEPDICHGAVLLEIANG